MNVVSSNVINVPTNLYELINETYTEYASKNGNECYGNCLLNILKKYHLWPSMQIKKYKGTDNLVLLHNTYVRSDTSSYQALYEQCRSVVLDFSKSIGDNIVVTYSNSIPERIIINDYELKYYKDTDICYEAYDGTMISVYYYNNEWYFGTTSCPDANSSKFSHPTKKHGNMFDEVLELMFKDQLSEEDLLDNKVLSLKLRTLFTSNLNPMYAYEFVLVHHENSHIIDYTSELGEKYKCIFHVNTKNRTTLIEENIDIRPLESLGIKYPRKFNNAIEAVYYIRDNNQNSYGFIVKNMNNNNILKLYKVSTDRIQFREETDPCNPNLWYNIVMVYMKNRNDYKINDYINYYAVNIEYPIDNYGNSIDPTYLVHTTISTIKDIIYKLYIATTNYYPKYNRFKMNKELDKQLPPILQFHLAQLRHLQTTIYKNTIINQHNVYYYLCHCNNIKNIKTLIQFFANNNGYDLTPRTATCFTILNSLLS